MYCVYTYAYTYTNAVLKKVHDEDKVKPGYEGAFYSSDLLPGLDCMIIVDSFDPVTRRFGNWNPFTAFYDRLIHYLFAKYSSVTFKTGFANTDTCTSLRRCWTTHIRAYARSSLFLSQSPPSIDSHVHIHCSTDVWTVWPKTVQSCCLTA